MRPLYQVALSFAGEDRPYVEQVARCLRTRGIRVFYDGYEEASLWGKDLYVHLRKVYQKNAAFTVMFISKHYAAKLWTNHERQSAQARAFEESREYVLPVRFDNTDVPGLPTTIGYIDIHNKSPQKLCDLIVEKLSAAGLQEAAGPRHRLLSEDAPSSEETLFHATLFIKGQTSALEIAVTPALYATFGELLDDIYANYLSENLDSYSYGLDWLVEGGSFSDLILVPWQWIKKGPVSLHKLAPEWFVHSPAQLGVVPKSQWKLEAISERRRQITMRPISKTYLLATNDKVTWDVVLSNAKAPAFLSREGYFKKIKLDASIVNTYRYTGVFWDWLSIGSSCAWVHSGDPLPPDLLKMFRYQDC